MKSSVIHLLAVCLLVSGVQAEPDLEKLASEDFQVREEAQKELAAWAKGMEKGGLVRLFGQYHESEDPEVKNRLMSSMAMLHKVLPKGFIGIRMQDSPEGVMVSQVVAGTPADRAGLQVGDLIVQVEEVSMIGNLASSRLSDLIKSYFPEETLDFTIQRGELRQELAITLAVLPSVEDQLQALPGVFGQAGNIQLLKEEQNQQARVQFELWLQRKLKQEETKELP